MAVKQQVYYVQAVEGDINWQRIEPLKIDTFPWYEQGLQQETYVKICQDKRHLYLNVTAMDRHSSAVFIEDGSSVYLDSCFEFFVTPKNIRCNSYLNFEINCIGSLYLAYNDQGGSKEATKSQLAGVQINTSLPKKVAKAVGVSDHSWSLDVVIPFKLMEELYGEKLDMEKWYGNFYRCGGMIEPQHAVWQSIEAKAPNFHLPMQFGMLYFEEVK